MLAAWVIQPSTSDWAAAPVLIRKKDGSVRWCVDYRALNKVSVKDTYPLTLIEECLDTLAGNLWFSKLDANAAYWQIKVNPEDRKKTAFITKYGLFEFTRIGVWPLQCSGYVCPGYQSRPSPVKLEDSPGLPGGCSHSRRVHSSTSGQLASSIREISPIWP